MFQIEIVGEEHKGELLRCTRRILNNLFRTQQCLFDLSDAFDVDPNRQAWLSKGRSLESRKGCDFGAQHSMNASVLLGASM